MKEKLILASASPRRRELLERLGLEFEVITADCDENIEGDLPPAEIVRELSKRKAFAVMSKLDYPAVVIGADTIVVDKTRILGKPKSPEDAVETLMSLSGRTHSVFTGMTITDGERTITDVRETRITFIRFSRSEAEAYVRTGEPLDKAGSYGIQGLGGKFVANINGDYYATVGLSICRLNRFLREYGFMGPGYGK